MSLIRGKLCELLAKKTYRDHPTSYMLIGMFSFIDTLLHGKVGDIVNELPLLDEVKGALHGNDNDYRYVLHLAKCIERNKWDEINISNISEKEAYQCYLEAVEWSGNLLII